MTTITSTEAGALGRYINLGSAAALDDTIKTAIVYCKPTAMSAAGAAYLLSKTPAGSTSGPRMYLVDVSGTKTLNYGATSSGNPANPLREGAAGITLGTWQHLIATDTRASVLASNIAVLANGTNVGGTGTDGSGARASDSANDLYLMNRGDASSLAREFVGDVAYWAFYDSVLDGTQIANVMANGPMAEAANLICVVANGTVYHGAKDSGNTISIVGRSTRVTGSLPPNTALGDGTSPATTVLLSGPSSGVVGVASAVFTVGANGSITGTNTVTPSDSGAGGAFTPTSVDISDAVPTATFTYTAASAGAKTISVTNSGGLSNPSSITYTATATATLNFQAAGMEFGSRTGLGISTFGLENGKSYRYTVHADGLTLGAALITSAAITLDSAGKFPNLTSSSLTAGATYIVCAVRQSDGAAAIFKMVAA